MNLKNNWEKFWAIFVKDAKEFWAVKPRVFFAIFFPLMFMTILGFMFPQTGAYENIQVGYANLDTPITFGNQTIHVSSMIDQIITSLQENSSYKRINFHNYTAEFSQLTEKQALDQAKEEIAVGKVSAMLIIPKNLTESIYVYNQTAKAFIITDPSNPSLSTVVEGELRGIITGISEQLSIMLLNSVSHQGTEYIAFAKHPIGTESMKAVEQTNESTFSFIAPGFIVMIAMLSGFSSVSGAFTRERELGTLDGILVTPLDRNILLLGKVSFQVARTMFQALTILAISVLLFNISIKGNPILILFVLLISTIAFLGIGVILTAFTSEQETAQIIVAVIQFPMMFLSGVVFPIEQMPEFLQVVSKLIPLTYAADAMRRISVLGVGLTGPVLLDVTIILAISVFVIVVGATIFDRILTR